MDISKTQSRRRSFASTGSIAIRPILSFIIVAILSGVIDAAIAETPAFDTFLPTHEAPIEPPSTKSLSKRVTMFAPSLPRSNASAPPAGGCGGLSVDTLCADNTQSLVEQRVDNSVRPPLPRYEHTHAMSGIASWYGAKFQGKLTANGEIFDSRKFTAAHKTLPFNTVVEVRNIANNKAVQARINDRGPFVAGRVIDLSQAAANSIGIAEKGIGHVTLSIVEHAPPERWSIQLGSFSQYDNAEAMRNNLVRHNINATIESDSSRSLYRVVVQNISAEKLTNYRHRLKEIGYSHILARKEN